MFGRKVFRTKRSLEGWASTLSADRLRPSRWSHYMQVDGLSSTRRRACGPTQAVWSWASAWLPIITNIVALSESRVKQPVYYRCSFAYEDECMNKLSQTRPESSDADAIAGEFVTETFDYGRQVMVYVPPVRPEAIVFAGDGEMISRWGSFLEVADVPSTMIVGVHRAATETLRLDEYSPRFDPERFAAHERFFVQEVGAWAGSRFGVTIPSERTAVFGVSAGGELALALGYDILNDTARFSRPRPAGATGRLTQCRVDCRAHILSPARENLSSLRTRLGGRPHCAMHMQKS